MALVALTFALQLTVGEKPGPRALLPVMGRSLLALVARQAAAAGADKLILLADAGLPGLDAALKAERWPLPAVVVHTAAEIAPHLESHDRVIVFDEGLVLDRRLSRLMAGAPESAALAVWPASSAPQSAVRLDADYASAGIGIYEASLVKRVAASLGDWDLQQTLPRAAIDAGSATFVDVTDQGGAPATRPWLWRAVDGPAADPAEAALHQAMLPPPAPAWPHAWLEPLIDRAALRLNDAAALPSLVWQGLLALGALLPPAALLLAGPLSAAGLAMLWPWASRLFIDLATLSSDDPTQADGLQRLVKPAPLVWLLLFIVWACIVWPLETALPLFVLLAALALDARLGPQRAAPWAQLHRSFGVSPLATGVLYGVASLTGGDLAAAWVLALHGLATLTLKIEAVRR